MKAVTLDSIVGVIRARRGQKKFLHKFIEECEIVNAIPISDNATKGEVFNALFDIDKDVEEVEGKDGYMYFKISADVWNASYKKGVEE